MNKYYVYSIKIYRGAYYRLVNILRLMSAKIFHNGLTINGMLSLEKGVRFVTSKGGKINLSGPIWLHQLSTLQADGGRITIGENTSIGPFTIIGAIAEVTIGKNCMIAECVSIRDHDHCYTDPSVPMRVQGWTTRAVNIGDNVWLGNKVTIMKGCTIGNDVIIGANSVVTHDIPSNSIAFGCPARVIKSLYPATEPLIFKNNPFETL
jgi:acetyltransferase-like isoleucine patch superfamily enzyme